jgi:hypothetical protein
MDAADLAREFYNSNQAANGRDQFGARKKFIVPVIANGRVYVGTPTGVAAFGLRWREGESWRRRTRQPPASLLGLRPTAPATRQLVRQDRPPRLLVDEPPTK